MSADGGSLSSGGRRRRSALTSRFITPSGRAVTSLLPGVNAARHHAYEIERMWTSLTVLVARMSPSSLLAVRDEVGRRRLLFTGHGSTWPELAAVQSVHDDVAAGRWPT